jgi:predicted nuclease with TOPRIM domain
MNMEIYSIISTILIAVLGGGWFTHYRAHKRQENAKAKQEEATAKQNEADAFKSMQDAYQQMHEDVLNRLKEVCDERDHYKDERDEERKANKELRQKYNELDERMTKLDLQYKRDISRLGRRIDVLSPFLCGVAGCMNRKKVSLMENIDDNSFATVDEREEEQVIGD